MDLADNTSLKFKSGQPTYRIRAAKRDRVYLGKGGFGITYLADCLGGEYEGRRVVIKTILSDHYGQPYFPQLKNDFFTEALKIRGCSHPHIVQVWDLFQESIPQLNVEIPCMVQEYIAGETLADRLWRKKAPLPEAEALKYIQHIASALAVVHGQNMAHRDVKPENIMLRKPEYQAVLIDFGLMRSTSIKTHTVALTPGYAPPEQYEQQEQRSPALDVYALAATLYVLLTGLTQDGYPRLVESRTRGTALYFGRPDPLQRPEVLNPHISSQVAAAIWQGMALDPSQRPATMGEWLNLMGLSLDTNPPLTPPRRGTVNPPLTPPKKETVNPIVTAPTQVAQAPEPKLGLGQWLDKLLQPQIPQPQTPQPQKVTPVPSPAQPLTFRLKPKQGGSPVLLEVLPIPGGSFWMGRPEREEGFDNELPRHRVTVPPFWMARTSITQAQWLAVMGDNPATRYNKKFVSPNQPVVGVSWDKAVKFCEALTRLFKDYQFRLPTEAEWEYACRAGTETAFYFGDRITTDQANFDGNYTYNGSPKGQYRQVTTPVGQFPANAWGLQDMHGNVWEWCADQWYDSYEKKPQKLKDNGSIPWTKSSSNISPSIDVVRMLRGGSWYSLPRLCRSARRHWGSHGLTDNYIGLRVVCVARTS